MIVDEVSKNKYRFRAESPFKKIQWIHLINHFTKNLSDDLQIIQRPSFKIKKTKIQNLHDSDMTQEFRKSVLLSSNLDHNFNQNKNG